MRKYQNYTNGSWNDPESGDWLLNTNPATGESIGEFPRSNASDVDRAAAAAQGALSMWRSLTAPARADYLYSLADHLKANKESFALDLCNEMGKIRDECLGDVQEAIDMALFCAGEGRRSLGMVAPSEYPGRTAFAMRVPIGVVGAITPWNYPMAMPAWKVMAALVLGNTIVHKPAEDTPHSAINLARSFDAIGLPAGVFNVVCGTGQEAGDAVVRNPRVNMISFTGSTKTGTAIAEKCPALFKRVGLEMGGKNVVAVCTDADLREALKGVLKAAFATSGQRCASAGRVLVHSTIHDDFVAALVEEARNLVVGYGWDTKTQVGPIINGIRLAGIDADVQRALAQGAHLALGGVRMIEGPLAAGFYYSPTILTEVKPTMDISTKEVFGPVVSIYRFDTLDEAISMSNAVPYGLTAAIYTKNVAQAMRFAREVEAGSVFVNAPCVGAELHLPFGGMKGSGNGRREGAHHALDLYSEWKSVSIQE